VKVSWVQTARRKTEGAMRFQVRQGGTRLYQGFGEGSEITILVAVLVQWENSSRGLRTYWTQVRCRRASIVSAITAAIANAYG
jgi:hypothetical protein